MMFSRRFYEINAIGKRIMTEIETNKTVRGPRGGSKLCWPTQVTYDIISTIVKPKFLNSGNLYTSLMYFMDELLFSQVRHLNTFLIEDDTYPLSFLYFNQDEWIKDWSPQTFYLEHDVYFNEGDALLLLSFIDKYEYLIIDILKFACASDKCTFAEMLPLDKRITRKLVGLSNRLKQRLNTLRVKALQVFHKHFQKIEIYTHY